MEMIPVDFWENLFGELGFEKTFLAGRLAFKIPIFEAIYLVQICGFTEWRIKKQAAGEAYIFREDGKILLFPNPCPSVLIKDITTQLSLFKNIQYQINPLLSPSINFIRKNYPEFFEKEYKYLMFSIGSGAVKDVAKEENLNTLDIVSLNVPESKEKFSEHLMTYIVSSFLRKKGFIVDPFNEALGTRGKYPDLFAFKLPEIQNKLIDLGIIEGGFYLNELELLIKRKSPTKINEERAVVIEIESYGKERFYGGKDQVAEYLLDGYYNEGYFGIPFEDFRIKTWKERLEVGAITITEKGHIIMQDCPKNYGIEENVAEVKRIVETIIKLVLLKNLPLKKVFDIFRVNSFYDIYLEASKRSIDEIIHYIESFHQSKPN